MTLVTECLRMFCLIHLRRRGEHTTATTYEAVIDARSSLVSGAPMFPEYVDKNMVRRILTQLEREGRIVSRMVEPGLPCAVACPYKVWSIAP